MGNRRLRRRPKKRRAKHIELVVGEPDHDCPICTGKAKLMEVTIRGDESLASVLPSKPKPQLVYEGATVGDLIEQLLIQYPKLFNQLGLTAYLDGEPQLLSAPLRAGDDFTIIPVIDPPPDLP